MLSARHTYVHAENTAAMGWFLAKSRNKPIMYPRYYLTFQRRLTWLCSEPFDISSSTTSRSISSRIPMSPPKYHTTGGRIGLLCDCFMALHRTRHLTPDGWRFRCRYAGILCIPTYPEYLARNRLLGHPPCCPPRRVVNGKIVHLSRDKYFVQPQHTQLDCRGFGRVVARCATDACCVGDSCEGGIFFDVHRAVFDRRTSRPLRRKSRRL